MKKKLTMISIIIVILGAVSSLVALVMGNSSISSEDEIVKATCESVTSNEGTDDDGNKCIVTKAEMAFRNYKGEIYYSKIRIYDDKEYPFVKGKVYECIVDPENPNKLLGLADTTDTTIWWIVNAVLIIGGVGMLIGSRKSS